MHLTVKEKLRVRRFCYALRKTYKLVLVPEGDAAVVSLEMRVMKPPERLCHDQ